jgi:hypothetical protein
MALKWSAVAIAAALAFVFASGTPAAAQQKKAGGQDKQAACATKAQAENPNRGDGMARQAAFKRCMSGR